MQKTKNISAGKWVALVIALLIGYIMQSGGFGSSGFGMYAGF